MRRTSVLLIVSVLGILSQANWWTMHHKRSIICSCWKEPTGDVIIHQQVKTSKHFPNQKHWDITAAFNYLGSKASGPKTKSIHNSGTILKTTESDTPLFLIIHFELVNCTICELCLNKAVSFIKINKHILTKMLISRNVIFQESNYCSLNVYTAGKFYKMEALPNCYDTTIPTLAKR